jgi:hypothetical protein
MVDVEEMGTRVDGWEGQRSRDHEGVLPDARQITYAHHL